MSLARISKNGKQDQGVAVDILCPAFPSLEDYLTPCASMTATAITGTGWHQQSAEPGHDHSLGHRRQIDGIIWSRRGNAALGPLVIKASAGTLYRAPLLCPRPARGLASVQDRGMEICTLEARCAAYAV